MTIPISPEMETLVHEKLASGQYASASELVSEALRLLKERDDYQRYRLEQLRRDIAVGVAQSDLGESEPLDIEQIKAEGRRLLAERASQMPTVP